MGIDGGEGGVRGDEEILAVIEEKVLAPPAGWKQ